MHNNGSGGRSGLGVLAMGGFLVVLGALFLLQQFMNVDLDWGWIWPFGPIVVGLVFLIRDPRGAWLWTSISILVGIALLLRQAGVLGEFELGRLWPLAIVAVGVGFVVNWFLARRRGDGAAVSGASGGPDAFGAGSPRTDGPGAGAATPPHGSTRVDPAPDFHQ